MRGDVTGHGGFRIESTRASHGQVDTRVIAFNPRHFSAAAVEFPVLDISVAGDDDGEEELNVLSGGAGLLEESSDIGEPVEIAEEIGVRSFVKGSKEAADLGGKPVFDGLQDRILVQLSQGDAGGGVVATEPEEALQRKGDELIAGLERKNAGHGLAKALLLAGLLQGTGYAGEAVEFCVLAISRGV